MKIIVLVENTAKEELACEHGLSLYIEHAGKTILLDAGTTDVFMENAEKLGVELDHIRTAVLSHGHYDHSGGFETYLGKNQEAVLYMMKSADGEYYSGKGELHEIGIPKSVLKKYKERFVMVDRITQIHENIYLVPHKTAGLDTIGARAKLFKKVKGELLPDDFAHELSLVYDTKEGLVIFNSCSHGGVKNIVSEVQGAFPGRAIYVFVGGLHMKGGAFSETEIREVAEYLQEAGIQYLYTGHCTGEEAYQILKKYGGEKIQDLYTGKVIDICQ